MKNILILFSVLTFSLSLFGQLDRSIVPKPQANPEIKINIPDAISIENGMKVIVVENHKLPVVSFQLYIDYPIVAEGDKAGLQEIFGELIACGSKSMSKDVFDAKLDYIGASLFTNPRGFFASSLKKHTPQLLQLLSAIILEPAFPEIDFDRIKSQNLSNLSSLATDANAISEIVGGVVNYGFDHPYGEVTTETTLGNITLEDIKNYYLKYFIPNYAYLVIVGDVTKDEAKTYVDNYFKAWQKGTDLKTPVYNVPTSKNNIVYFVDKPGAVQSVINITNTVTLQPGHPDEIALKVLNGILGGGSFSARLMANLREDKAYTYGCYSGISSDQLIGEFSAGGSFRNEVTDSAIVQILFEIDKICKNPVLDSELELTISSMTGAFARSLEQPQTVARFALNTIRYNLPKDYYSTYLVNLGKVTKEDLMRVAAKYLRPSNLNIVVVGNQSIADKLGVFDADGAVHFKDFLGQDKAQLKSVAEGVTVESIIQNYAYKSFMVDSKSAWDAKLSKVGFIQSTYSAYVAEMDGNMIMTTYEGKPNKSAMMMKISSPAMNAIVQKEWFDGTTGGTFAMGVGKTVYEGAELADKLKPSFPYAQLFYSQDATLSTELLGIDEISGKEYYKIKVGKIDSVDFSYEYYGVESGYLEKKESFTEDESGEMTSMMMNYSDFKDMGKGLIVPYSMELVAQGASFKFKLESVVVKKKAKSKAFTGVF